MRKNKKLLTTVVALVLVLGCAVGGTLAYLHKVTEPIGNTFTVGDIKLTLTGTALSSEKIVPGSEKTDLNFKATVGKGSEACWLFVKIDEQNNTIGDGKAVSYTMADGWTALSGHAGVYYKEITAIGNGESDQASENDVFTKLSYSSDIAIGATPSLKVTAAAIQKENLSSATGAYNALPDTFTGNNAE